MATLQPEAPTACPACGGALASGYGLAGGGTDRGRGPEPGVYWMCTTEGCAWMGPTPQTTICFPHGRVPGRSDS